MAYYDLAQHLGDTGHALFELAVHGKQVDEAKRRLAAAVAGHSDSYARSRAFSGLKLAELTMCTDDPRHAVAIGNDAISVGAAVQSRRLDHLCQELARASFAHRSIPEVENMVSVLGRRASSE